MQDCIFRVYINIIICQICEMLQQLPSHYMEHRQIVGSPLNECRSLLLLSFLPYGFPVLYGKIEVKKCLRRLRTREYGDRCPCYGRLGGIVVMAKRAGTVGLWE